MAEGEKWFAGLVLVAILCITSVVHVVVYRHYRFYDEAIKNGYEQRFIPGIGTTWIKTHDNTNQKQDEYWK